MASRFTIGSPPRLLVTVGLLNFIPTAVPTLSPGLRVSIARSVTRPGGAAIGPYARIGSAYRKQMSAPPQRATLGGKRLREQIERRANRRFHGDFRVTWRFDRRFYDEIAPEPEGQGACALLPHLGDARGHAQPLE